MRKADAASRLTQAGHAARGLDRAQAAAYIGVSETLFSAMVEDGRMPRPKCVATDRSRNGGRLIWDVRQLDLAFDRIPGGLADAVDDDWSRPAV